MPYSPLQVKVWGDIACYTRPEAKVERVTYEVMTPSAARGVLEAIFWKPEMQWEVRAIHVLRPIRHISFLRNEVTRRAIISTTQHWAEQGGGYYADEDRTQRHTLALRDVAYLIVADVRVLPGVDAKPAKYREQFQRRVQHGQYHTMPYLGCREFSAFFSEAGEEDHPIPVTTDLGRMLFDMDYQSGTSGRGQPRFFQARLDQGVLHIPPQLYETRRRSYAPTTLA